MSASARAAVRVSFQPEGRSVFVLPGTALVEAAVRAGIVLDTPCGGRGDCGKCRVRVLAHPPQPTQADLRHLSPEEISEGYRLACQVRVSGEMSVSVPLASRFFEQKILTDGRGRPVELEPTVRKRHVRLEEPTLQDSRADLERLLSDIGQSDHDPCLEALRELPGLLRGHGFDLTAVTAEGRLLAVEPGDTTSRNYGMAFDVGTTTVVGFLLDLAAGREAAVASRSNPQVAFGDDVVSRIHHASRSAEGLEELRRAIVKCLNDITSECCEAAGIGCSEIYEATVVGNTTMLHLLLGVNPAFVAQAPYVGAWKRSLNVRGGQVGLRIHPRGLVHVLPQIAGFVGADTVGVILASGLHQADALTLAIDVGTNGELVIGNRDRLVSCSTAAGPAFEGARIRFGMRAAPGAIDRAVINQDLEYNVIGNLPPRGICGTALIDLVAELLRVGCIDPTGRLLPPEEWPRSAPEAIRRRIVEDGGGLGFVVAQREETALEGPILLTQRDVRELQLAKGAISAGVSILMKEMGVEPGDLEQVLLAGAFGSFVRRSMARRIGLLPPVPTERVRYIGNAAGAGARMALLSRRCKEEANRIADRTEYLELAGRPDFQTEFGGAMLFPEG